MNYFNINGQAAKTSSLHLAYLALVVCLILCCADNVGAQTTAFTYQGKLTDAGNPANGNYDLQFKLFDTVTVGTGAQQGATLVRTPVVASAGNFTITLDFGANVFGGADRFLEIGVRPAGSVNVYTVLSPRQPITSVPYAIQTLNAQQLGGLPASTYVTTASIGNAFIKNDTALQSGANFNLDGNGTLGGNLIVNGNVGIGTPIPTTKLYVLNSAAGVPAIYGESASSRGVWGKSVGSKGVFGESTSLEGVQGVSSTGTGVSGVVTTSGTGVYGFSAPGRGVWGESTTFQGVFGKSNSNAGVVGEANLFHGVYGVSHSSNNAGLYGTNDANGFGVAGVSVGGRGVDGLSTTSVGVAGKSTSGPGVYGESGAVSLTAGGVYGKATTSGGIGVIGEANSIAGFGVGVFGVTASAAGFGGYFRNTGGGSSLIAEGTARVGVLQIDGGSDLAEKFEVGSEAKPGMVVVIDPQNAGRLSISRGTYNRRVAGIISGANNLSAGMVLPDLGKSKTAVTQPVALTGRVWAYCDATKNAIHPGDLLTTSTTPGHAMKVINHQRAQGAIIGKAMTGLKSGRGLVLVLVMLQ